MTTSSLNNLNSLIALILRVYAWILTLRFSAAETIRTNLFNGATAKSYGNGIAKNL
ncbi:hypothetical protein [Adhaeribacter pallidiroseus]|uniref:Uncharacterized protein n=1 Tax=Adhaeribacter pallidiroseus TaxID=2072847 RepID=A0A369QI09_9BACT|nr:hypothetical protein [Adhaeribacter pallidiroseus]RDC64533.1 hypothetical protein AHMF7616_03147 [Adhaeribacter pallidiroseus]